MDRSPQSKTDSFVHGHDSLNESVDKRDRGNESMLSFIQKKTHSQVNKYFPKSRKLNKSFERSFRASTQSNSPGSHLKASFGVSPMKSGVSPFRARSPMVKPSAGSLRASLGASEMQQIDTYEDDASSPLKMSRFDKSFFKSPIENSELNKNVADVSQFLDNDDKAFDRILEELRGEKSYLKEIVYAERIYQKEELREIINDLYKSKEHLIEDVRAQCEKIGSVRHTLENITQIFELEFEGLRSEFVQQMNAQIIKEREKSQKHITVLQSSNEDLKYQVRILQECKKDTAEGETLELHLLRQELGEKKELISKLKRDLALAQNRQDSLENDNQLLQHKIEEHQKSFRIKESKLNEEISSLNSQLNQQDDQVCRLEDEFASANSAVQDKEREVFQLRLEIENLTKELENAGRVQGEKEEHFGRQLRAMKDEIDSLQKETFNSYKRSDEKNVEMDHMKSNFVEVENQLVRENEELKRALDDKDSQKSRQKNEWAEIYSGLRSEISDLKGDIDLLNDENERLLRQIHTDERRGGEINRANSELNGQYNKLYSRLKDKEQENDSLWGVLRDMTRSGHRAINTRELTKMLSLRNLESKAKKRIK